MHVCIAAETKRTMMLDSSTSNSMTFTFTAHSAALFTTCTILPVNKNKKKKHFLQRRVKDHRINRSLLSHMEKLSAGKVERLSWSRRGSNPVHTFPLKKINK
jgi:hypothetical protein